MSKPINHTTYTDAKSPAMLHKKKGRDNSLPLLTFILKKTNLLIYSQKHDLKV